MVATSSSSPCLTILTVGSEWLGEEEAHVLRQSLSGAAFNIIHCPLELHQSLCDVPGDVAAEVNGVFINRHWLREGDLDHFPRLRCVVRMGVGWDRIDRAALDKRGIKFCNTPDYGINEVADHTVALALTLQRGILLHHQTQSRHRASWDPVDPEIMPLFHQLSHRPTTRTWAAIGFGRIGSAAAMRAQAFGWKVIFYDPYLASGYEKVFNAERVRTLDEVFKRGDIVSLHCRLAPDTKHMVNDRTLGLVKPGSILVNTARGGLVDLDAIERALRDGRLAAAGLDVLETEPPVEPLPRLLRSYRDREPWLEGRLVITPHVAYYSEQAVADRKLECLETMRDVLLDDLRTNVVPVDAQ